MSGSAYAIVVCGAHLNGLSVCRELQYFNLKEVLLLDSHSYFAKYSNSVKKFIKVKENLANFEETIQNLVELYGKVMLIPTNDIFIDAIFHLQEPLRSKLIVPYSIKLVNTYQSKAAQLEICKNIGVNVPRTVLLSHDAKELNVENFQYDWIAKPTTRIDETGFGFRNLICRYNELGEQHLIKQLNELQKAIKNGVELIVSEVIHAEEDGVFSYCCYKSRDGEITSEWCGRKLSQHPNEFGVFSSATSSNLQTLRTLGRKIATSFDTFGFIQPEFKYCSSRKKLYLMEINFRPMMWHHLGHLNGKSLIGEMVRDNLVASLDTERNTSEFTRCKYIFMTHEISNLILRKGYIRHFRRIINLRRVTKFAVWSSKDPLPAIIGMRFLMLKVIGACIKRLF